jgi:hypothetical protein
MISAIIQSRHGGLTKCAFIVHLRDAAPLVTRHTYSDGATWRAFPRVPPLWKGDLLAKRQGSTVGTYFGKENELRRLMLLLGLLAAMMLVASPVLAHQGGPTHGHK